MSDELPGEIDAATEDAALRQVALRMFREVIEAADDRFLTEGMAIYHEEWERRHGERWVLAPELLRW